MKKNNSLKVLSSLIGVSGAILLTPNLGQAEEVTLNSAQPLETSVTTQEVAAKDKGEVEKISEAGVSEENNPNINYIKQDETLPLTSDSYKRKTASELATLVREKKVTSEELIELAFAEIEKQEPALNALINDKRENGLANAKAKALEDAKKLTDTGQPFLGVPIVIKGLGHTMVGGEASRGLYYREDTTSKIDSSVVKGFRELGFVPIAQSNYPEEGYRNNTNSHLFGPSRNPWDLSLNSGGSSGGSAAAIASGMVPIASASDAGGSIRIPSSWTSLVGYKPSRGAFRKESGGLTAHFPITKSVGDAIVVYNNYKEKFLKNDSGNFVEDKDLKKYKIAYSLQSPIGTVISDDAKQAVLNNVNFLKEQGFELEEVDFPLDGRALMRDYTNYMMMYGLKLPANVDKTKLDPITYGMARVRANAEKEGYKFAPVDFGKYEKIMNDFFGKYNILLTPTATTTAPLAEDWGVTEEDKKQILDIDTLSLQEQIELMNRQWEPMLRRTPYTPVANLSGGAAASLPTYLTKNSLPIGTMFSVKQGDDNILLNIAKFMEDNNRFILKSEIAKKIQAKGTSLTQEEKAEITNLKLNGIVQEEKPKITNLKLNGLVQGEKSSYPEWKLLSLTLEKPVLDLSGTEVLNTRSSLEEKRELIHEDVRKAIEKLEKSSSNEVEFKNKDKVSNTVLPKTSASSNQGKELPIWLGVLMMLGAISTKRRIRK